MQTKYFPMMSPNDIPVLGSHGNKVVGAIGVMVEATLGGKNDVFDAKVKEAS